MNERGTTVFLVDVDNTLLNNDLFQHELKGHIETRLGAAAKDRYWAIQDALFHGGGYRDYLGAFQQMRAEFADEPEVLWLAGFVLSFPYETLLFPGAMDVLARLRSIGRVVLLTDGDAVFQPLKLLRWGPRGGGGAHPGRRRHRAADQRPAGPGDPAPVDGRLNRCTTC